VIYIPRIIILHKILNTVVVEFFFRRLSYSYGYH